MIILKFGYTVESRFFEKSGFRLRSKYIRRVLLALRRLLTLIIRLFRKPSEACYEFCDV